MRKLSLVSSKWEENGTDSLPSLGVHILLLEPEKGQNQIQYDLVQRITQATEFVLKAIEELDNLLQV